MTQRDNILQELKELGSTLANVSPSGIYNVPNLYFEELAGQVLKRIKALEASNSSKELAVLSPLLGNAERITPYQVPAGYFEELEQKLMHNILVSKKDQTPKEELESLSPLLSGLKKQSPYTIPEKYFDNLVINQEKAKPASAKIISLGARKWFRYAAAAVIIGFVAIGAFLFIYKNSVDPDDKPYAWVKKNMNKVSTDELDEFIEMTEEEIPVVANNNPSSEVKELVKSISEEDIQAFLNDVQVAETESDEELFLN